MNLRKAYLFVFLILLIDQASKIYIKTNFYINEQVKVFDWFRIYFVENEGMAWGAEIPGNYGKLFLTLFRIVAVGGISWWLYDSIKKKLSNYLTSMILLVEHHQNHLSILQKVSIELFRFLHQQHQNNHKCELLNKLLKFFPFDKI